MKPSPDAEHVAQVKKQLKQAGVTFFGMLKQESRYLPKVLHHGEVIGGCIYGQYKDGSGMLVATDRRVLFIDRKPGYTISEDISYEVVAGISYNKQGSFAAVTLHTRLGDFGVSFVNIPSAEKFTDYIEKKRLEHELNGEKGVEMSEPKINQQSIMDQGAQKFLESHKIGVFSTNDRQGKVHGAVMYYASDDEGNLYVLTKSETEKAKDILANNNVAFTIFEETTLQTLQIEGEAVVETRQTVKDKIFSEIMKPRWTVKGEMLPPAARLREGSFVVIMIVPKVVKFRDYTNAV